MYKGIMQINTYKVKSISVLKSSSLLTFAITEKKAPDPAVQCWKMAFFSKINTVHSPTNTNPCAHFIPVILSFKS